MTAQEQILAKHVRRLRPHAKFIHISHSRDFIDAAANLGEGFFNANLYDERIDANLITSERFGRIMIQNTYLTSFAYNMFLCWLASHRQASDLPPLDLLLAHNFKKFFAEQVYRLANRVPARALLLETLLFEQVAMVPVFAATDRDPQLSADTDAATQLMSLILAMHELGHYMLATQPEGWSSFLQAEPDTIGAVYNQVLATADPALVVEFQCDVYAIFSCLNQFKDFRDPAFAFRILVFSFGAYAAMYSALKTAQATASVWLASEEEINLRDISTHPHVEHDVRWELDRAFMRRARWVQELCQLFAARSGIELFGGEGPFPLPSTILNDLLAFVGRVFDCPHENARKMSNLVAQSLAHCDDGMEYLYLRSKTFRNNRNEPLTI